MEVCGWCIRNDQRYLRNVSTVLSFTIWCAQYGSRIMCEIALIDLTWIMGFLLAAVELGNQFL